MISFIVPAYNEEAELPGTLRAIRSSATGYEHLDEKLSELGAHIERVKA